MSRLGFNKAHLSALLLCVLVLPCGSLVRLFVHVQCPDPTGTGCRGGLFAHLWHPAPPCGGAGTLQLPGSAVILVCASAIFQHRAMTSLVCLYSHLPRSRSATWRHRHTCLHACHDSELPCVGLSVHVPVISLQCCVAQAYLFACLLCSVPLCGNVSTPVHRPAANLSSNIWLCKRICLHFWGPSSSIT